MKVIAISALVLAVVAAVAAPARPQQQDQQPEEAQLRVEAFCVVGGPIVIHIETTGAGVWKGTITCDGPPVRLEEPTETPSKERRPRSL